MLAQDIPVQLLVVDNRSTDGTAAWLLSKPNIATIFPQEQWSLAKCWNTGLRAIWRYGGTEALVINNDVSLRPDTARTLLSHGGEFVTGVSVDRYENWHEDPAWKARMESERPHPDFSCFLICKSCTDRVGWFNEECFPAYAEDGEYHVRMHRAGVRAVCIDMPFLHHRGSTIGSADAGEIARIQRGADANRERFRQAYGCLPGSDEYNRLFETP